MHDSTGYINGSSLATKAITDELLLNIIEWKRKGFKIKNYSHGNTGCINDNKILTTQPMSTAASSRIIVVDCSAADNLDSFLLSVLRDNGAVILANKKPLADSPLAHFRAMACPGEN